MCLLEDSMPSCHISIRFVMTCNEMKRESIAVGLGQTIWDRNNRLPVNETYTDIPKSCSMQRIRQSEGDCRPVRRHVTRPLSSLDRSSRKSIGFRNVSQFSQIKISLETVVKVLLSNQDLEASNFQYCKRSESLKLRVSTMRIRDRPCQTITESRHITF
jgi:hypothetical protein